MVEVNGMPATLLEMAQKVHDDFIEKGRTKAEQLESDAQAKHDELIANAQEFHDISILEAESSAAGIVEDAQFTAFSTVRDANIKAAEILAIAQDSKLNLETSILKLQEFESAYRNQLQALVSGAQATLAVAQLAAEENRVKNDVREPYYVALEKHEAAAAEAAAASEEVTDDSDVTEAIVDDADAPEATHYTLPDSQEPESYDPLAKPSVIDPETVASIIKQADLNVSKADVAEPVEGSDGQGVLVGTTEADESVYYDPITQRSGTDPEIAAVIIGEPGGGKSLDSDDLKLILDQDSDVILIDEIRENETVSSADGASEEFEAASESVNSEVAPETTTEADSEDEKK